MIMNSTQPNHSKVVLTGGNLSVGCLINRIDNGHFKPETIESNVKSFISQPNHHDDVKEVKSLLKEKYPKVYKNCF